MHEAVYTDRDVRESEELRAFAERYIQAYKGDWQPLLDRQFFFIQNGYLTTPHARMVLNAARQDGRYSDQLPAPASPLRLVDDNYEPHPVRRGQRQTVQHVHGPRERPFKIELSVKWKQLWVMSAHKTAYVIHRLDPEYSTITYWRHPNHYQLDVRFMCRQKKSQRTDGPKKMAFYDKPEDSAALHQCRMCNLMAEERAAELANAK
jgi:hypothetical protein